VVTADHARWLAALIAIAMGLGLVTAVFELVWLARSGRLKAAVLREMAMSLSMLIPNVMFALATVGIWAALYVAAHERAWYPIEFSPWSMLAALVAVDLSYYWEHRLAHRLPLLWRLYHAPHHSSHAYTVATAYRVSFLSQLLAPAFYLPWVWLGFHPLLIVALQLFAFHWQAWLHTEWIGSMGVLDRWFNTPASHRLHHSSAPEHRDRNLGAITLVWDRLFRTYAEPSEAAIAYGITGAPQPTNPIAIYLLPWHQPR
jgi:sterol desaturase/sphingolipid hydroxylase (fatty acid hydroxylase superfamily)